MTCPWCIACTFPKGMLIIPANEENSGVLYIHECDNGHRFYTDKPGRGRSGGPATEGDWGLQ